LKVLTTIPSNIHFEDLIGFLDRLQHHYAAMDREFTIAAQYYGFQCDGCKDNCCRTRFYHHTYLEYFYIRTGFEKLDQRRQAEIRHRANDVCREMIKGPEKRFDARRWCPLNHDGLCILYHFRPMICRLHGIPFKLQKPGQNVSYGPGCGTFDRLCADKPFFNFDRTPLYLEMAKLESEFKRAAGLTDRIKMTVAEMIVSG
jgi:Fe-S-cluster containining protein